jgi:transposase
MMDAPLVVIWSWPRVEAAEIQPTSVTVSREPCGRWYVAFAVEVTDPEPAPPAGAVVGVDRGEFRCSACGHRLAELPLSTRAWRCPSCRTLHDRDINAAKNILAAGRAVAACGGDVRHPGSPQVPSPAKQEPRFVRTGTPVPQDGE